MVERYISPAPPPTPYEREVIEILAEECNEVAQRCMKLLRFGADEVQPGQKASNAERLAIEIGDVSYMTTVAIEAGLVRQSDIARGRIRKRLQLAKYMQTTKEGGSDEVEDPVA